MSNMLEIAKALAKVAHEGQTDKTGAPYIDHPRRVAERLRSNEGKQVGWLHDVLEDTPVTVEHLRELGFSKHVVEAVVLLTRKKGVTSDEYYAAIKEVRLARLAKLADIDDNTDPERTKKLTSRDRVRLEKKYADARAKLSIK
jgi:(p)ppGpp synthase/HD superfamily hydrolase